MPYTRFTAIRIAGLVIALITTMLIQGCTSSHLEIFPELEDPTLTQRSLPVYQLHEDIDAYYFGALERHPDLKHRVDPEFLQQKVDELKQEITRPMNRLEFFRVVGKLTQYFDDGHSLLLWPYPEFEALREAGAKPFPFALVPDAAGRTLLRADYHNRDGALLRAGTEITAINGIPMVEIVDTLQQYAGGESRYLRSQFTLARVGRYLWASYGFIDNFTVAYRDGDTSGVLDIQAAQEWTRKDDSNTDKEFYYRQMDQETGYLYVGHFDIDIDWFEDFVDNSFASIREQGIKTLIVDIRDNTGGNTDSATYLARYFAQQPFRMVSKMSEKLNHDNRGIGAWRGDVGEILETDWDDWVEPMPSDERFDGDTYLLIGPITYSSGIVFATAMQDNGMATLIGAKTGGNANQTAQGNLFNLPNSQLRAYIATRLLVRPNGNLDAGGVKPDRVARPDAESLRQGIDVAVESARKLAREKLTLSTAATN